MNKIYIPIEWVQEYKVEVFKNIKEILTHEFASMVFEQIEENMPQLNFDNPEYETFYCVELDEIDENTTETCLIINIKDLNNA